MWFGYIIKLTLIKLAITLKTNIKKHSSSETAEESDCGKNLVREKLPK